MPISCKECLTYGDCEWVGAVFGSIVWVYWCTPEMAQSIADMLATVCPYYVLARCSICDEPVPLGTPMCEDCYQWLREVKDL